MEETIVVTVNGRLRILTADSERPLLEVLREDLQLTGTKHGCGETPIIALAPAVANAVFHAAGTRVHEMPVRLPDGKSA